MKILIFEDDDSFIKSYRRYFSAYDDGSLYEVTFLETLTEAEFYLDNTFPQETDVVAVIFDGSMNQRDFKLNTLHLVSRIKESGYKGIMLANSSEKSYNRALLDSGCTHTPNNKGSAIAFLFELL